MGTLYESITQGLNELIEDSLSTDKKLSGHIWVKNEETGECRCVDTLEEANQLIVNSCRQPSMKR